jgi:hypothetical protein
MENPSGKYSYVATAVASVGIALVIMAVNRLEILSGTEKEEAGSLTKL